MCATFAAGGRSFEAAQVAKLGSLSVAYLAMSSGNSAAGKERNLLFIGYESFTALLHDFGRRHGRMVLPADKECE